MIKSLRYLICFSLCFLPFLGKVQAQKFKWTELIARAGLQHPAISGDKQNNLYILAQLKDSASATVDTLHFHGPGSVVLKYDTDGKLLWSRMLSGIHANAITTNDTGMLYMTGYYDSTVFLGDTTYFTSRGGHDIVVAVYNAHGKLVWARTAGGPENDEATAILSDDQGNVMIGGNFRSQATFGVNALVSTGEDDIFMARYDTIGALHWLKRAGGNGPDSLASMRMDPLGNLFVAGQFSQDAYFNSVQSLHSAGLRDIFVAHYDADFGDVIWLQGAGGTGDDILTDMDIDAAGRCYVTGSFSGSMTAGGSTISAQGSRDVFVGQYYSDGTPLWLRSAGSAGGRTTGMALAVDGESNVYITGSFAQSAKFGITLLSGDQAGDIFVAKYSISGNVFWAKKAGGTGADAGTGILLDKQGNVFLTGMTSAQSSFDSVSISGGDSSLFLAQLYTGGAGISHTAQQVTRLQMYPNPATQCVYLQGQPDKQAAPESISIYNTAGQEVYHINSQPGQERVQLDISSLPAGLYILRATAGQDVYTGRLVKE